MWKASIFLALLLLLLLLLLCNSNELEAVEFDFGTLTLTSLKLLGDAHLKGTTIRLSRDLPVPNSGAGRALFSRPIKLSKPISFSTFFTFTVTNLNPSSIGGGLAFLISPDDLSLGDAGGYLGVANATGAAAPVVAVEFDTLMDVEFKDINGNHVGVDLGSMVSAAEADLGAVAVDLKSGDSINAWIEYDGAGRTLNVSVSYSNVRPAAPVLSMELDLSKYVADQVFVGFSGSTQGSTEVHSIEWWSFSSKRTDLSPSPAPQAPPSPPAPPSPTAQMNSPMVIAVTPPPAPPASAPVAAVSNSSCHSKLCRKDPLVVGGVATAGAFVLAILAGVFIWFFFVSSSKRFKSEKKKAKKKEASFPSEIVRAPKEFAYRELKAATRGFDPARVIGNGAFGTVYKGIIPETGAIVAVKRCSHDGEQGKAEFLSELSIIGTLRHRNLVRLHGWCHEKGEILLVYDYMPNGSLDKALFESKTTLPWPHRRKILVGVASALAYLHHECEKQVIHRDVKASNVMLDEQFNAKLGDFGLARQVEHDKSPEATIAAGTMGYLAPEYLLTGRATDKTDVFSFGAVVLEVACGRRPIEKDAVAAAGGRVAGGNLVEWAWGLYRDGRMLEAADGRLGGEYEEEEMRRVLLVGLICSHPDPISRPGMRNAVQMLGGEAPLPYVPTSKPCLSFDTSSLLLSLQDSVSDYNALINASTSSSES